MGRPPLLGAILTLGDAAGREWTARLADELCRRVASGNSPHAAAASLGVSRSALEEWVRRGENRDSQRPGDELYAAFAAALKEAQAKRLCVLELLVFRHARNDGRLALEALARLDPEDWGRKGRLEERRIVTLDDVEKIADALFGVVMRHVHDPEARLAMARDLERVMRGEPEDEPNAVRLPYDAVPERRTPQAHPDASGEAPGSPSLEL